MQPLEIKNVVHVLMFAVLAMLASVPDVYGRSSLARDDKGSQARSLQSHEDTYTIIQGVVIGEASAEVEALIDEEIGSLSGIRQLLHGDHSARRNSICPVCKVPSGCTGSRTCLGHCRSGKRLFSCGPKGGFTPQSSKPKPHPKSPPKSPPKSAPESPPKPATPPDEPPKSSSSPESTAKPKSPPESPPNPKPSSSASASAKASTKTK